MKQDGIEKGGKQWLERASQAVQLDPRQRFKLNGLQIRTEVERLEGCVSELDQTLADLRKIRAVCATLPRVTLPD